MIVALVFLVAIIGVVAVVVVLGIATMGFGVLLLIPLICIMIPVGFFFGIYLEQANIALVVEDIGIRAAFGKGWEVLRNNFGPLFVMGLILVIGTLIVALIVGLPMILIFVPIIFAGGSGAQDILAGGAILSLLLCLAYLPILLLLGGIIETYRQSAWVLTYMRLTGHEPSLPELEVGTA